MAELYHHGILGQRWGIRRFQNPDGTLTDAGRKRYTQYKSDRSEIKSLTRQVAAGKRNLRNTARALRGSQKSYDMARNEVDRLNNKIYAPWNRKKRMDDIDAANKRMVSQGRVNDYLKDQYDKGSRYLAEDSAKLVNKANRMIEKYGNESIKEIKYRDVKLGKQYLASAPKTGVTVADIPLIRKSYVNGYVRKKEYS